MLRLDDPRLTYSRLAYTRDPVLVWGALLGFFALLVVMIGLMLGHAIAERRAAMLSFVNSYQIVAEQQAARPVRVIPQ
jgi:hypothetical protein